jgi:uncharacterized caspase-like protein
MFQKALLLLLLLVSGLPLHAERYAVLVGVGKYLNGIHPLDGPVFDVEAMREMLLRNGYSASAITVLLNEQGTRAKILAALRTAVSQLKSGDHLLIYYSGHGTSAFDTGLQWLSPEIGPDSGALATYDLSLASLPAAVESLVIGRRDLRPILSHAAPGSQVLVVMDACYSENSAKSLSVLPSSPIRGINVVEMIQGASGQGPPGQGQSGAGKARVTPASGASEGGTYPYLNVVSLSAASKDQPALDINLATMQSKPDWRTVDGKPHGALTNTLLEALSGPGDTNHDGTISYDELYRYVRRNMEKFPHQPQLLASKSFMLDDSALGEGERGPAAPLPVSPPVAIPRPSATPSRIRVAVQPPDAEMEAKLRVGAQAEVVTSGFDLLVRRDGDEWGIHDESGVLIKRVPAARPEAVVASVQAQGQVTQLRLWSNPAQTFNVRIDAEPDGATGYDKLRTVFRVREKVRFKISTERPAFLLFLGLDKDGRVTVLFPGPPAAERLRQASNKPVEFVVEATPPAGSEQLKLIGFLEQPAQWQEWSCSATACPSFDPGDARMAKLMQMLRTSRGAAEASLRVITQQ